MHGGRKQLYRHNRYFCFRNALFLYKNTLSMRKSCVLRIDINIAPMKLYAPCRFTVVCTLCANICFTQSSFFLTKILFIKHVILCCCVCSVFYVPLPDQVWIQHDHAVAVLDQIVIFHLLFQPLYALSAAFKSFCQLLVGLDHVVSSLCIDQPEQELYFEDFAFQEFLRPKHVEALVSLQRFRVQHCVAGFDQFPCLRVFDVNLPIQIA